MFKNLKLTKKITYAMLIPIVGIIIIAVSSYRGLDSIGAEIKEISEYQMPINTNIVELQKDILKEEILTFQLVIESKDINSKKFQEVKDKLFKIEEVAISLISEIHEQLKEVINHSYDESVKNTYKGIDSKILLISKQQQDFKKDLKIFIKDLEKGNLEHAYHELDILKKELSVMDKSMNEITTTIGNLVITSTKKAKADEESIILTIEITSLIVILLAIIILYLLSTSLKTSINNFQKGLEDFFAFLNKEKEKVEFLDDSAGDEIGNMSKIVNQNITGIEKGIIEDQNFIKDVKGMVSSINKGILSDRLTTNIENKSLNELKDNLNIMIETLEKNIGTDVNSILEVLNHLSENNYKNSIDSTTGEITTSLNGVIELINEILLTNKKNGLVLAQSSNVLLSNVDTLNSSSISTAASLEETAAAIEEITGNISSTTNTIAEMSQLANEVTNSVKDGENLANKTNVSMDEINKQVTSINDAITVIDQIAFQTNILSLNAAVEAATAGEAGKGFAVVAAEVRNLASRSAEAAKEIKDLVENANVKANEGKKIANDMIEGYEHLNGNINKTISLISDVNTAAKEQQLGIEQINDTVNSLDQQTQKNAIVASETKTIALKTSQIAETIVTNANEKEFNGKESIEKELNYEEAPVQKTQYQAPKTKSTPKIETSQNTTVKSSSSDDEEWESF